MIFKFRISVVVLILLLLTNAPLAQQGNDKITLAVMDFKNNTPIIRLDRMQRAIADMLKTELSHYSQIVVLERSKIEAIIAERALAQAGFIEEKQAQEVGRLAGAEYIITGEINDTRGRLRLDAHLIKVATGQILGEKVSGSDIAKIEPMIKLLANNLIYDLTGAGERKTAEKLKRYYSDWALVPSAVFSLATAICHFKYKDEYDKYHRTVQLSKFDYYYDRANRYYKARNIMLVLSGVAVLTTMTLWQQEQSDDNMIYAQRSALKSESHQKRWAIGLSSSGRDYLVSLNFRF